MSHGTSQPDPLANNPALGNGVLPLGNANTSVWDAPMFGKSIPFDELVDLVDEGVGQGDATPEARKPVAAPENRSRMSNAAGALSVAPAPAAVPRNTELAPTSRPSSTKAGTVPSKRQFFTAPSTCDIWGLKLSRVTMDQTLDLIGRMIVDRIPRYVITANLNYAMLVEGNPRLAQTTASAAMVLADGQPLVWRSRLSEGEPLPERVTGSELIYRLAQQSAQCGWRIYFLGAEPGVAQKCADTLANRYPGLQVAGVQSPPYRKLTDEERQEQRGLIQSAKPDILLVAFGQPKGELWIEENYQSLGVPVSIQLGASFDFVAGRTKRAPKIWQVIGLEWAYRMMCDPKRLIPRYSSNAWFLFRTLLQDWKTYIDKRFGQHRSQASTVGASPPAS